MYTRNCGLFTDILSSYINGYIQVKKTETALSLFMVSVLETEKSLVLAEKGSGDDDDVELIRAATGFRLVATMNPGGDFGKKEVCNTE